VWRCTCGRGTPRLDIESYAVAKCSNTAQRHKCRAWQCASCVSTGNLSLDNENPATHILAVSSESHRRSTPMPCRPALPCRSLWRCRRPRLIGCRLPQEWRSQSTPVSLSERAAFLVAAVGQSDFARGLHLAALLDLSRPERSRAWQTSIIQSASRRPRSVGNVVHPDMAHHLPA
jgi:hypothetical protein